MKAEGKRPARGTWRDCLREFRKWRDAARVATPEVATVLAALRVIDARPLAAEEAAESPIFLLANGWRTGSTLLQRVLVSDPSMLMWGEPLGRMALVPRLTEMLAGISEAWPPGEYWLSQQVDFDRLTTSWIANLFPPGGDLRAALRAVISRWLAAPAAARGYRRWGFKEVRLSAADACLLRWLYPNARFIVLMRHPVPAYRSASRWMPDWYFHDRYPDVCVDSAAAFARHWNRLALSWRELPEDFDHIFIRYEELTAGRIDFRDLEARLDLRLDEAEALEARVGGTPPAVPITWYERYIIGKEAAEGMRLYGYA